MSFIIKKKYRYNGAENTYYYLAKNYRENKKIKRKILLALEEYKTVRDCLEAYEKREQKLLNEISENEKKLDDFIKTGKRPLGSWGPITYPKEYIPEKIRDIEKDLKKCREKLKKIRMFVVP